jgi:hypothetical protein
MGIISKKILSKMGISSTPRHKEGYQQHEWKGCHKLSNLGYNCIKKKPWEINRVELDQASNMFHDKNFTSNSKTLVNQFDDLSWRELSSYDEFKNWALDDDAAQGADSSCTAGDVDLRPVFNSYMNDIDNQPSIHDISGYIEQKRVNGGCWPHFERYLTVHFYYICYKYEDSNLGTGYNVNDHIAELRSVLYPDSVPYYEANCSYYDDHNLDDLLESELPNATFLEEAIVLAGNYCYINWLDVILKTIETIEPIETVPNDNDGAALNEIKHRILKLGNSDAALRYEPLRSYNEAQANQMNYQTTIRAPYIRPLWDDDTANPDRYAALVGGGDALEDDEKNYIAGHDQYYYTDTALDDDLFSYYGGRDYRLNELHGGTDVDVSFSYIADNAGAVNIDFYKSDSTESKICENDVCAPRIKYNNFNVPSTGTLVNSNWPAAAVGDDDTTNPKFLPESNKTTNISTKCTSGFHHNFDVNIPDEILYTLDILTNYPFSTDYLFNMQQYPDYTNPNSGTHKDRYPQTSVCLLDYTNAHLEQYQRVLCNKLPEKYFIGNDAKKICRKLEKPNWWSWEPTGSVPMQKWYKHDYLRNNPSIDSGRKKDFNPKFNNKRLQILFLIIGILILFYMLKKY